METSYTPYTRNMKHCLKNNNKNNNCEQKILARGKQAL
jgi:hypothetical protein